MAPLVVFANKDELSGESICGRREFGNLSNVLRYVMNSFPPTFRATRFVHMVENLSATDSRNW